MPNFCGLGGVRPEELGKYKKFFDRLYRLEKPLIDIHGPECQRTDVVRGGKSTTFSQTREKFIHKKYSDTIDYVTDLVTSIPDPATPEKAPN